MDLWNVQVYHQGELVSIDVVEEPEVQSMIQYFESLGYEVRSELAWKPAQLTFQEADPRQPVRPTRTAALWLLTKLTNQEASS